MCTCERALELISMGLDGEWKEEERQELEEHLAHCGDCRALARELEEAHVLLSGAGGRGGTGGLSGRGDGPCAGGKDRPLPPTHACRAADTALEAVGLPGGGLCRGAAGGAGAAQRPGRREQRRLFRPCRCGYGRTRRCRPNGGRRGRRRRAGDTELFQRRRPNRMPRYRRTASGPRRSRTAAWNPYRRLPRRRPRRTLAQSRSR
ncbi:MAG: zf-HC2 domain-containing protein [Intestinimonas sp.]